MARSRGTVTQESMTIEVALNSNPADAVFLSGRAIEGLAASCEL